MSGAVVARTERGWAGHFIAAASCSFRRNTLLVLGSTRIIVSTVGAMSSPLRNERGPQPIGYQRFYETMAFHASEQGPYLDADVGQGEIDLGDIERGIYGTTSACLPDDVDNRANDIHERAVEHLMARMAAGETFTDGAA